MTYQLPPLSWLRAYESAARNNSFTAAAKELNLTPAAISHQVRSLEETLGYQLFERLPKGLRLTSMGHAYLPSVRKAFRDLSKSTMGLFGVRGNLSITVRSSMSFGVKWLAPRLKDFFHLHPNIDVRLTTTNWPQSDVTEEVDVDIRYGDGNWDEGETRIIENEKVVPVCSPGLAAQINQVKDLTDFNHIHIMGVEDSWDQILEQTGIDSLPPEKAVKVDNSISAMEMAASGFGIALIFYSLAESYIQSGLLDVPLGLEFSSNQAHYIILPRGSADTKPESMLFREWLLQTTSGK